MRGRWTPPPWWPDLAARRAVVRRAGKTKTGTMRVVPIGQRLAAVLEMLRTDPEGSDLPQNAFVFGDEIGQGIGSVETAWRTACREAGVADLHFHDLRREFAVCWSPVPSSTTFATSLATRTSRRRRATCDQRSCASNGL